MMKRSLALATTAATALLVAAAGPASAHDCYNVSRSDQGDASATHSDRWVRISVVEFAHSPDFPPGFDPDCFVGYWLGHGGPEGFTTRSDKTIGEGSANPNLADGHGLEHIEDAWGALFGEALGACALP
ncbi:hypothetical protein ACFFOS_21245 [Nocardioides kongjuensis]|uniref:Uncharacterized protein n=1 Tax=Nocardioides kongjuensis TaxID=349522 RepID=A0A852RIR7_9ACTN|nr:hypothetical protein [Nocardioides kongjuensis]NYD29216.1 hypothetical protein [Nocardioides kongjuensis]